MSQTNADSELRGAGASTAFTAEDHVMMQTAIEHSQENNWQEEIQRNVIALADQGANIMSWVAQNQDDCGAHSSNKISIPVEEDSDGNDDGDDGESEVDGEDDE